MQQNFMGRILMKHILLFIIVQFYMSLQAAQAVDYSKYANTNRLVWDKKFEVAVKSYFTSTKFDAFYPGGLLSTQILAGLGGPPNPIKELDKSIFLASACRPHSCMEKAAVIFKKPSTILAFGLIHFNCKKGSCDSAPTLSIFSKNEIDDNLRQALETWAFAESERMPVEIRVVK